MQRQLGIPPSRFYIKARAAGLAPRAFDGGGMLRIAQPSGMLLGGSQAEAPPNCHRFPCCLSPPTRCSSTTLHGQVSRHALIACIVRSLMGGSSKQNGKCLVATEGEAQSAARPSQRRVLCFTIH